MTKRLLNRRQARWAELLADYQFELEYRPGKANGNADALSRRSDFIPIEGGPHWQEQHKTIFSNFSLKHSLDTLTLDDNTVDNALIERIRIATQDDLIAQQLATEEETTEWRDGILLLDGLIYVPNDQLRVEILQNRHDSPVARHFGAAKTIELVRHDFTWPSISRWIRRYVNNYTTCRKNKNERKKTLGLLHPIPPKDAFGVWTIDFITDLTLDDGYDTLCVMEEKVTKLVKLTPCTKTITGEETAKLVFDNIFKNFGIPLKIIFDRGPQFISNFWKRFLELLGSRRALSSGYHPETDGQTENINQTVQQYLRMFISYRQDDWTKWLGLVEFAYNNSVHASTRVSPFYATFGRHPHFDVNMPTYTEVPAAEKQAELIQKIHTELKSEIRLAQKTQKRYADQHRREQPKYQLGQKVWLLTKNLRSERAKKKLDQVKAGPFEITEVINDVTIRLNLPPRYRMHPVFHNSVIERFEEDPFPGRQALTANKPDDDIHNITLASGD